MSRLKIILVALSIGIGFCSGTITNVLNDTGDSVQQRDDKMAYLTDWLSSEKHISIFHMLTSFMNPITKRHKRSGRMLSSAAATGQLSPSPGGSSLVLQSLLDFMESSLKDANISSLCRAQTTAYLNDAFLRQEIYAVRSKCLQFYVI